MCFQLGTLDVVVPPDFISEETSGDIMVPEGGIVKLACKARGHPAPHVLWRREDGEDIIVREPNGQRIRGECGNLFHKPRFFFSFGWRRLRFATLKAPLEEH